MAHTQRIRRKDLRQPDEFVTLSRRAVVYLDENRTVFFMVLGGLVLLLVAVIAFRAVRSSRQAGAAQAYGHAHALLDDKKYPEAATAFQQLADGYTSTSYAVLAQLEAANALLMAGKSAEAAPAYQKFLDAGPPTDYLRQAALVRLGQSEEQNAKLPEAARAYASAAEMTGPYAEEALTGQARVAEATGDAKTATDLYARFLEKYPESDRRALVTSRLAGLGWTAPAADAAGATADAAHAAAVEAEAAE